MKRLETDVAGTQASTIPKLVTYNVLIGCIAFTLIYCVLLVVMVLGVTGNFAPLNESWGPNLPYDSLAIADVSLSQKVISRFTDHLTRHRDTGRFVTTMWTDLEPTYYIVIIEEHE